MKRSWSTPFVDSFDQAFHEMKVDYQRSPQIFLDRMDVVSDLYHRLRSLFELKKVETARYTIGKDGRWRQRSVEKEWIETTPIHVSLGKEKGDKTRADICFIDLDSMQFAVTARYSGKNPSSVKSWRFISGGAVSVVRNSEVQYSKRRNTQTGRFSKTEGMKELEREVIRELANLQSWDKAILLIVDDHCLFTRNELENTFSKKLSPYTMKLYYLSPKSGFFISGKRKGSDQN
jgi:hypothetical protein